ncbi:APC family permease [Actinomadura montaniterrae]|uniref:APC family permease n=1 Tax=Actinomadura montaniterrae TaxID=1803903 RepID=A0A6L3VE43_9ACTN|nr:APC family permease [Actinomadura montaniterrae]KAB2362935.1 APC family permease [Actinomadura montaniterrae]
MTPSPAPAPPGASLKRSLGVLDGVVIAASSTAATTSIGIGTGVIVGVVGLHGPILALLAFLPVLCIGGAFARLNRVEPNAGNAYVWVGRVLNPWLGFLVGWVNIVGTIVFLAYTTTVTGSALMLLAGEAHVHRLGGLALNPDSNLQATLLGMVVLIAVTATAVAGVNLAARFQRWLLVFEYLVLLGFCGYGLVVGDHPFSLEWFDPFGFPSAHAFAQGMVLSVFTYWGFDAVFSVSEEVRDHRDASRAGLISLFTMLALFLLGSVSFQRVLSAGEMADHGAQGLTYFGAQLARQPLAVLPLVALTFSAVASLQAGVIPTVRGMFAMGRDRTLGPVWTRVHPRFGTPAAGTVLIGVIAAAVAGFALVIPKVSTLIEAAVNAIGIVVALYYGLTALAAAVRFRGLLRTSFREGVRAVVLPVAGALALFVLGALLCADFATSTDHFALRADNGWFELSMPALMVGSGLVAAGWAKWVRRSPYFNGGRATDADAPDLLSGAAARPAEP